MSIILQFPRSQYPSLQVGDIGYYAIMNSEEILDNEGNSTGESFVTQTGGFQTNDDGEDFVEIGAVLSIDNTTSLSDGTLTTSVEFDIDSFVEEPTLIDFIFFAKNDKSNIGSATNINKSSLLGYYAKAKFINTDSNKAEIYTANSEVAESSK
mgnify:CR=1 FL=1